MATTNFTISGHDLFVRDPYGTLIDSASVAIVQWDAGYDPAVHTLSEWTSSPVTVSWTGWYQRNYPNVGVGIFGSNGTLTDYSSPLYLFIDLGSASNVTQSMYGQVWLGQVTGNLTLSGQDQIMDINSYNIRTVVGSFDGVTMTSADFNTWTPTAIPEPSYSAFAVALFAVVVLFKKFKKDDKVSTAI